MKENPNHVKVFELYYTMGSYRSLAKLCQKYPNDMPKLVTLKSWSKAFNWQQRVEQRDIENNKALEDKLRPETSKIIVNSKADYRAEIKTQLGILKAILNKVIQDFKKNEILDVENVKDLEKVINSYEKLCKLDLLMMGESTERGELKILNAKQKLIDKINNIASRGTEEEDTE